MAMARRRLVSATGPRISPITAGAIQPNRRITKPSSPITSKITRSSRVSGSSATIYRSPGPAGDQQGVADR